MHKVQENKLSMYLAVQKACKKYPTVWDTTPGFVNGFSDFESRIAAIESAHLKQLESSTGVSVDKKTIKAMMVDKALIIAGMGHAYAADIKNSALKKKFKHTRSGLINFRDVLTRDICEKIFIEATEIKDNLKNFGLVATDLTRLDDLIDSFSVLILAPREVINERKGATSTLDELFTICDEILTEKLDKMALKFSETNTEFYKFYTNSRTIFDFGLRHEHNDEGGIEPVG